MTGTDFNHSEQHILSIRLSADGFSFSTCQPGEAEHAQWVSYSVNPSCSMTANLKNMCSTTDILQVPSEQTNVLIDTQRYTILPFDLFEDENMETIFYHNFQKIDNEVVLCNILSKSNTVVLFGMDKHTYQLLNEQFPKARIYATVSPLIEYFVLENRKLNGHGLYIHLRPQKMDVLAFDKGKLLLANSYSCKQVSDLVYYMLYIWQQIGFNPENDSLFLTGEYPHKEELIHELSKFIRNVEDRCITANDTPFDMQTLFICE